MSTNPRALTIILATLILTASQAHAMKAEEPSYSHLGEITSPHPQPYRLFGTAISIWGDTIAVGEPGSPDPRHNHTGRVYIIELYGNNTSTLQPPQPSPGSNFGISLATGDGFIVVGESNAPSGDLINAGAAHIYDGEGGHLVTLRSPDPYENASFGVSVAAHGGLIVVGEPGPYGRDGDVRGRAHLFDSTGALLHTLEQPQTRLGNFGLDVGIGATAVIVGEPHAVVDHDAGRGRALIYDLDGTQVASLESPGPGHEISHFGWAVDLGGEVAVVGEVLGDAGTKTMAGVAYIYGLDGSLIRRLQSPAPCTLGAFGNDVAVSDAFIAVSEPRGAATDSIGFGCVHVYNLTGGHLLTVNPPQGEETSYFGFPLDVAGDALVTGDLLWGGEGAAYAGKVYAYRIDVDVVDEPAPVQAEAPTAYLVGAAALMAALALWLALRRRGRGSPGGLSSRSLPSVSSESLYRLGSRRPRMGVEGVH